MQLASFENLRHLLASRESSAKKNLQILSQTNLKKKCEQKKQSQTLYESSRRKRTDAFVGIPSIPSKMPRIPREALFAITHFHFRNKTRNIEWFPCARSNLWHPSGILRILKKKPIGNPVKPWKKTIIIDWNWLKTTNKSKPKEKPVKTPWNLLKLGKIQ